MRKVMSSALTRRLVVLAVLVTGLVVVQSSPAFADCQNECFYQWSACDDGCYQWCAEEYPPNASRARCIKQCVRECFNDYHDCLFSCPF
jgi:hypothetical protein